MIEDPRIQAISTYLLTAGAAPSLLALSGAGRIPERPAEDQQAMMRLHTYSTLLREGWVRYGTNTYVDPRSVPDDALARLAGNECIGAAAFETFLLGVGPQAVSSLPGARLENRVDVEGWSRAVENGEHPFFLPKCSTVHQTDAALWAFPLRAEGLPRERFERMLANGALSVTQLRTLDAFIEEGLVVHTSRGHELSILGEVFMGHLVRDLKKDEGRRAVDEYIAEGRRLAADIAAGHVRDSNNANNRQLVTEGETGGQTEGHPAGEAHEHSP
jgi:oxygen-independent coproporphyrinogen-3 oxidase